MLNSILFEGANRVDLVPILLCMATAVFLGLIIAITHKYTSKGSKNFLITVAILPILVQTIIIMVNGNLGTSVAIMGAFSLVRFRSLPGSSKEILSVFLAMTIGLVTGMGHIGFAFLVTFISCLFLFLFYKIRLFDENKYEKLLQITVPENLDYSTMFDEILEKYTLSYKLVKVKTVNMGSLFDLTFQIVLKKSINEKEFVDELRVKNGNLKIIITHPLEGSEL